MYYINVYHLQLFYLVARFKSFSAAARELNISQPGVSAQIRLLESEMGELIDHETFELTDRGRKLYNHSASFYRNLDVVAEQVRMNLGQPLRIGGSPIVMRQHVPDVGDLFFRRVQGGSLKTMSGSQEQIMEALRNRELDLIITELNNSLPRGITGFPLIQLKVVVIVHRDLAPLWTPPAKSRNGSPPLALKKAGLKAGDIPALLRAATAQGTAAGRRITSWDYFAQQRRPREILICPAKTECVAQIFHAGLQKRGMEWPVRFEVGTTEEVTGAVLKKIGVGATVSFPPLINHPDLVVLDPGLPPITYGVAWRGKGNLETKTMEAILATARELWPDEPRLNGKAVRSH